MKYALILLAALTASSVVGKPAGVAPVQPGWLGLGYQYNVTNSSNGRVVWLFVRQIAPGSPAERAGVKIQDVITGINGNKISFSDALETLNFFNGIRQGDRVQLQISRGRTVQTISILADALPPDMAKRRLLNAQIAKSQRGQP